MAESLRVAAATVVALVPVLAVAALAGCGGDEEQVAAPAERTPADAFAYSEVVVRPEGDLEAALDNLLARFPEGERAGEAIVEAIEEDVSDEGVEYEQDVEPWLGERVAGFGYADGDDGAGAALIETTDPDAAWEFLESTPDADEAERREHEGVELLVGEDEEAAAVFDGLVAVGDVLAVERAIESEADGALAQEEQYVDAVARAQPEAALALGWIDSGRVLATVPRSELGTSREEFERLLRAYGADPDTPVVLSLAVGDETVRLDQISSGAEIGDRRRTLGELPADSVLALSLSGFTDVFVDAFQAGVEQGAKQEGLPPQAADRVLERALGLNPVEFLESVEGLAMFIRGSGFDLGGAVLADVSTEREAAEALLSVRRLLERSRTPVAPLRERFGGGGYEVRSRDLPFPVVVTRQGTRVVAATGVDHAAAALGGGPETLAESGALGEARALLGEGFTPAAVVDGDRAVDLLAALGAGDAELAEALPYLEPLSRIVSGTRTDGDVLIQRTVVEVPE